MVEFLAHVDYLVTTFFLDTIIYPCGWLEMGFGNGTMPRIFTKRGQGQG